MKPAATFALILILAGLVVLVLWSPRTAQAVPAQTSQPPKPANGLAVATFAGGCFWCMEPPYDKLDGVASTTSGYTGGRKDKPSYEEVSSGGTGHTEAVQVVYDPRKVSYQKLLDVFWHNIDPFAVNRQFCDAGEQYRSAIFYHGDEQKRLAEASKQEVEKKLGKSVATQIVPAAKFWSAEEYHQDYYKKNPIRYNFYRSSCGRDRRLQQVWGDAAGGH